MPADAKCGLLVGVGVVVAVAILFFRTDSPPAAPPPGPTVQTKSRAPAAAVKPPAPDPISTRGPGVPVSRPIDPRPEPYP